MIYILLHKLWSNFLIWLGAISGSIVFIIFKNVLPIPAILVFGLLVFQLGYSIWVWVPKPYLVVLKPTLFWMSQMIWVVVSAEIMLFVPLPLFVRILLVLWSAGIINTFTRLMFGDKVTAVAESIRVYFWTRY